MPTGGLNSAETERLVREIRAVSPDLAERTGATLAVTGRTALNIDVSERLGDALVPYLMVVVGLSLLLLGIVFRSVWVPVKATLGFVLSLVATLGVVVAVFQWGWPRRRRGRPGGRADPEPAAHHHHRHRVRPGHGLRGVPGHPDAQSTCTVPRRPMPWSPASPMAAGWSRRPPSSWSRCSRAS
ncbi:MAG: MMPL family transporter [Chloroflexota bacterium]